MKRTLALIFVFLALMIGSFIWFVATWDASREQPVSAVPALSDREQYPHKAGVFFAAPAQEVNV